LFDQLLSNPKGPKNLKFLCRTAPGKNLLPVSVPKKHIMVLQAIFACLQDARAAATLLEKKEPVLSKHM